MATKEQAVRRELEFAKADGMLPDLIRAFPNLSLKWVQSVANGGPMDTAQTDVLWEALGLDESALEDEEPEPEPQPGEIAISVWKDYMNTWQMSIDDDNGGYRLYGQSFIGRSELIFRAVISKYAAKEIRRYLDKIPTDS